MTEKDKYKQTHRQSPKTVRTGIQSACKMVDGTRYAALKQSKPHAPETAPPP